VRENLAFPLEVKKTPLEERKKEVARVAEILGLEKLLDRFPRQLSGGQRQRVAIGRCLARRPEIYCFDEPLSNLDAALRSQIRVEIKALQRSLGKTALYVTHDQVEAMTMADRIVVLNGGVVEQLGTPEELYATPANRFVARFIGTPSMSLLKGRVANGVWKSGALEVPLDVNDGDMILGVRPEDVRVVTENGAQAKVAAVEPVGESGYLHLDVEGLTVLGDGGSSETRRAPFLLASIPGRDAFQQSVGSSVQISLVKERCHAFDPETGKRVAKKAEG